MRPGRTSRAWYFYSPALTKFSRSAHIFDHITLSCFSVTENHIARIQDERSYYSRRHLSTTGNQVCWCIIFTYLRLLIICRKTGLPRVHDHLGPILFIIFINDLPGIVGNVCKLFADDCKLYKNIKIRSRLKRTLRRYI